MCRSSSREALRIFKNRGSASGTVLDDPRVTGSKKNERHVVRRGRILIERGRRRRDLHLSRNEKKMGSEEKKSQELCISRRRQKGGPSTPALGRPITPQRRQGWGEKERDSPGNRSGSLKRLEWREKKGRREGKETKKWFFHKSTFHRRRSSSVAQEETMKKARLTSGLSGTAGTGKKQVRARA